MGLRGYSVVDTDFGDKVMQDKSVTDIVPLVKMTAVEGQAPHSASMEVYLEDGEKLYAETAIMRGHPDNPLSWDDLRAKFDGLVVPVVGKEKSVQIWEAARAVGSGKPGSLPRLSELLAGDL
jgi:2-methylcitrate dehydratase PrpD